MSIFGRFGTVKCPYECCRAVVQPKKFKEHTLEKECSNKLGTSITMTLSNWYLNWDGKSKKRGKEFDLDKEINCRIVDTEENYFVFEKYCPKLQSLMFAVTMA